MHETTEPQIERTAAQREFDSQWLLGRYTEYYAKLRQVAEFQIGGQEGFSLVAADEVFHETDYNSVKADTVNERMLDNRQLLEDINPSESDPKPMMSIMVPIAAASEKPETVDRLLGQIAKSQADFGQPVEVILWANARQPDDTVAAARPNYEAIKAVAAEFAGPDVQIRSALQILPQQELTMSRLRSNYMEALTVLAGEEGYDVDHPVLWLDADTTFLTKNCLAAVNKGLDSSRSIMSKNYATEFVHLNMGHSIEWAPADLGAADDATKALVFGEVLHQIVKRRKIRDFEAHSKAGHQIELEEYPEESGLGFRLSTYLLAGGLNTSDPVNEAYHLTKSWMLPYTQWYEDIPSITIATEVHEDIDGTVPIAHVRATKWLPNAKISTSARRLHSEVIKHGLDALEKRHSGVEAYQLYSDTELGTESPDVVISQADIEAFSEDALELVKNKRDQQVLERLMRRLFK